MGPDLRRFRVFGHESIVARREKNKKRPISFRNDLSDESAFGSKNANRCLIRLKWTAAWRDDRTRRERNLADDPRPLAGCRTRSALLRVVAVGRQEVKLHEKSAADDENRFHNL